MLSVTNKRFMLNVDMLSIIMLSVVVLGVSSDAYATNVSLCT